MTNIDQEIRAALMEGQSEEIQELGQEQNIWNLSMELFRGRQKWLNILGSVFGLVFTVGGIWALLKLLAATELQEIAQFGLFFITAFIAVGFLKIWFWMEMNRNSVVREILRLELRIQELSRKLDQK